MKGRGCESTSSCGIHSGDDLHTTLSLKRGGGLYLNIWLVSTIHPHKCVDLAKSHDDLPVVVVFTQEMIYFSL